MARTSSLALAIPPRGLTREQAAGYLGLTTSAFDHWVRQSRIPGPLPGTRRWDRSAIDSALDKLSGLTTTSAPSAYDRWKAEQNADED